MKSIIKIVVTTLVCLTYLNANPTIALEKDVVAMVNGVKIKKAELDRGVKRLFPARYFHKTISDVKIKAFEEEVLSGLINKELLIQHAKAINISVPQDNINKAIKYAKRNSGSEENFNKALKKAGFTLKTFKDAIYKEELLKRFYKEKIEANLSEEDLLKYYNENRYKFKEPEKIIAKLIYIKNDPTDPNGKEKAKKRVEEAYQKIKDGENFSDIAVKYSTAMSRIKGGDLGYVHKGMLEPAIEKKAFSMDANTTSEIIDTTIGFFVVRVEEKVEPNQLSFERVKKSLKKDLKEKIEKERKDKLLEKLKSTAVILK